MKIPELKDGEEYVGAIINPDGTGHHIILLDGDNDDADWNTQMEWAKSIGGDLPDRVEQSLLYTNLKECFQERAYWSGEQHAAFAVFAWYQNFYYGTQDYYNKGVSLRARAVRRVAI